MTILEIIDNAIADWETSSDAMRWTPDPPAPTRPWLAVPADPADPGPALVRLGVSFDAARAPLGGVADAVSALAAEWMRPLRVWLDRAGVGPRRSERVRRMRAAYRARRRGRW